MRIGAIGLLFTLQSDSSFNIYHVYEIDGKDDVAKYGVTRQLNADNRPQRQIPL